MRAQGSFSIVIWVLAVSRRHIQRFYYSSSLFLQARFSSREQRAPLPLDIRYNIHHTAVEGRGGYLFHRDHDAFEQFGGAVRFRPRQLAVWRKALERRFAWAAANNCKMRFLVIPEKHLVYGDALPWTFTTSKRRPVIQLMESLRGATNIKTLYPLEELRAARATKPTFLKTDTHWSTFGAFIGYQVLARDLSSEEPLNVLEADALTWQTTSLVGDLGVRFEPELSETADVATPPGAHSLIYANRIFDRGAVHVYTSDNPELPRCVLFRDSFANALIPYLSRNFSRIVAVSTLSCFYDLLEHEKPDVVIFCAIERFIATFGPEGEILLPEDEAGITFASQCGVALSDLPAATPRVSAR